QNGTFVVHNKSADQPLHVTVLPRTSRCNQNLLNVHSFNSRPERFAVYSVAISNEIPRSSVFRKCFDDLLCCPNRRWMLGDVEVEDTATIVRQDNEDIQHSQLNRWHRKEIDGYQLTN